MDRSPAPDIGYIVTEDHRLESPGPSNVNMSFMLANAGVYDRRRALEGEIWTATQLRLNDLEMLEKAFREA